MRVRFSTSGKHHRERCDQCNGAIGPQDRYTVANREVRFRDVERGFSTWNRYGQTLAKVKIHEGCFRTWSKRNRWMGSHLPKQYQRPRIMWELRKEELHALRVLNQHARFIG